MTVRSLAVLWIAVAVVGGPSAHALKARPLAGRPVLYTVQKGDTLYRIARRFDVGQIALRKANRLTTSRVKPGQRLRLPTWHILPAQPPSGVVLNIPERRVYLFRNGVLEATHAVAVGRPSWQTVLGTYRVVSKLKDPTWTPPKSLVDKEGVKADPVPPGPENPLGDRWMGWSAPGTGFHSTNSPRTVGSFGSHGCVRLYPEQARAMFDHVTVGTPIYSIYEPIKLGKDGGRYYLSVFPDVYGRGGASLPAAEKLLAEAGLLPLVDPARLRQIVAAGAGYPEPIIGSDEQIEVNGLPIATPVGPTLARGSWMVPARQVAQALGGTVTAEKDGAITVSVGARLLSMRTGEAAAALDGRALDLPIPPTVLDGTLMMPLRPLLDLTGARFERDPGKALRITTGGTVRAL